MEQKKRSTANAKYMFNHHGSPMKPHGRISSLRKELDALYEEVERQTREVAAFGDNMEACIEAIGRLHATQIRIIAFEQEIMRLATITREVWKMKRDKLNFK